MCVYLIENRASGRKYVGVTSGTAGDRWRNHVWSAVGDKRSCPLVARAIAKYGPEMFTFSVLDTAETREQLSQKEKFWIGELGTLAPNGYNLTTGGDATFEVSEEAREKLRYAAANRSAEWSARQSEAKKAWFAADPERRKTAADRARKCLTGKKRPQHVVDAVVAAHKGATRTEQHKVNSARAHMNGRTVACSNGETYLSSYEAAIATGCDKDKIGSVCNGKRKSTGGFKFWYEVAA